MRAVEASEVNRLNEAAHVGEMGTAEVDASLGQRLRAARERMGLSQSDVAARLKLPVNLIGRLENDDYEGLTQGVFLQGYLGSYARLVGIPIDQAQRVAEANTKAAPLVATGTISRSRYLFDRYSVSATYLVLTAIIVVPAVWLATHGGLEQNLARTMPLDPAPNATAQHEIAVPASTAATDANVHEDATAQSSELAQTSASAPTTSAVEQGPIIASMTPFVGTTAPAPAPADPADDDSSAANADGGGAHTLELKLSQQSWVEVIAADGRKLEYGMLAAGSEHSYHSDGPVSVRIGNAEGAVVHSDGTLIDLSPFQRGNVAHVKLFGANGVSRIDQ